MNLTKFNDRTRDMWPELSGRNWLSDPFRSFFSDMPHMGVEEDIKVDLMEEKDQFVLTADLPGVKKDDLDIKMENDVLTISASRKNEYEKNEGGVYRRERSYGQFSRSFYLGSKVDGEKIGADYTDGVLKLKLPKREEVKAREIKVNVK